MTEAASGSGTKPTLTFVLIHGTFGRGKAWVVSDADDSFRDQLRDEFGADFDVRFEVVNWGEPHRFKRLWRDNKLGRRFDGAVHLVGRLSEFDDVSPTNRRYLVAHSHGGSVAMYALNNPAIRNKVSGVVCLSSPFLRYRFARFHRDLLFFSALVLIFIAAAKASALLWAYTTLYALVAGKLLLTQNFGHTLASVKRLEEQRQRLKLPEKKDLANESGPISFLAVRPHRDEVAGLFWFTQNAGRGFRALWQFVNTVGRWGLYLFLLVRGVQWIIDEVRPETDMTALDNAMSMVDQQFMTPIMVVATAVLLGMVVMRLSYAFDALPWVAGLDLRAKIVPWDDAVAVAVDTFGWIAHTSVQRQAPPKIADWIRRSHQITPDEKIDSTGASP